MKLTTETYAAWYQGVCQQACGWKGAAANGKAFVLASVKQHVRETGHETAVIRTSSIHYRKMP